MLKVTATELPRVMHCMGSLQMPRAVPQDVDREARDKGNAEHWLAEQMFKGWGIAPDGSTTTLPPAGTICPLNQYVITDDMIEAVSGYVSALDCGSMEIDTSYSGAGWEVRGRADHVVYRDTGTLTIDDYKGGWRIIEPDRNWTLLSHAIGWVIRNETRPDRIILRIHQPRPYHPDGPLREWWCSYEELMGYYHQIDHRLSNPVDELVTGLSHCAKCHALALCPAAREAGMNAIDASNIVFDDTLPKDALTHELETLRHAVAMIENRRDALDELISYRIAQGEVFDNYALERRQGQRRWKPGLTGQVLSLAAGVDLTKDGAVTPAEAERRGVNKKAIELLTERPMLEPKLKRIDVDARARAIFGER